MKRKTRFAAARAVALTASLVVCLVGCTGGNPPPALLFQPGAELALSRGVRVAIRFIQPAPEGYLNDLTPQARQQVEAEGGVFNPTEFIAPPIPARGYYLKIGDRMIPSGPGGEFFIPNDLTVPGDVPLFKQLSDTQPIGTVNIAGALQPSSSTLQTVFLELRGRILGTADEMDGITRSRAFYQSRLRPCCKEGHTTTAGKKDSRAISDGCRRIDCNVATNDPATGCCLDFDVAKGRIIGEEQGEDEGEEGGESGGSLTGFCLFKRVSEFYGTECYKWTVGSGGYSAACINERAILQVTGPGCWSNHKYRFCQNMSPTAFSISSSGTVTVQVGSTLSITVHNNTPANETAVNRTGDANGTINPGPGVKPMGGGTTSVEHYDDGARQHINDRTVVYAAPAELPQGKTEATDTLTFTANGHTRTLTIRVVQKCQDGTGGRGEKPCQ